MTKMNIDEFIDLTIKQIRDGVNAFNNKNNLGTAFMPDDVKFELMVDNEGFIGGTNKITITIPLQHHHLKLRNG